MQSHNDNSMRMRRRMMRRGRGREGVAHVIGNTIAHLSQRLSSFFLQQVYPFIHLKPRLFANSNWIISRHTDTDYRLSSTDIFLRSLLSLS